MKAKCFYVLLTSCLFLGCARGPSFDRYVAQLRETAGEGAIDCGVVLFENSRSSAVSCAKLALKDQQSFVVVFQVAGIDSEVFRGLAMDRGGSVFLRLWDSDASGGYAFRRIRQITELPCDDPMLTDSDRPIECGGLSPGR